jgi:hypothetical protein
MNLAPTDLPVILLHNLDRSWPASDIVDVLGLVQNLADCFGEAV